LPTSRISPFARLTDLRRTKRSPRLKSLQKRGWRLHERPVARCHSLRLARPEPESSKLAWPVMEPRPTGIRIQGLPSHRETALIPKRCRARLVVNHGIVNPQTGNRSVSAREQLLDTLMGDSEQVGCVTAAQAYLIQSPCCLSGGLLCLRSGTRGVEARSRYFAREERNFPR
jgi:hypothetical protein